MDQPIIEPGSLAPQDSAAEPSGPDMRHFMFAYTWFGDPKQGVGTLWLCSEKFPALQMLKAAAIQQCPEPARVVITNWNEFESVADYDDFLAVSQDASDE